MYRIILSALPAIFFAATAFADDSRALILKQEQEMADSVASGGAAVWDKYLDPSVIYAEEDGTYKLWRITHRRRGDGNASDKPHADATKLLILAVMQDAAARNLVLETDGSTPGLAQFYAIFGPGIFRRTTRLQCEHETIWSMLNRYYPSVFGKPASAGPAMAGRGQA